MKRIIKASVDTSDLKKKISRALHDLIKDELWEQNNYYKQIRRQFTVNGKKYVVKNDSKGRLHILTPEGEELYGYAIPYTLYSNTTDDMAARILTDAFGDEVDLDSKRVYLNIRSGQTQYGANFGGEVTFGPYVDHLRNYYNHQGDVNARYAAVLIKAWWSNHDETIIFSDDANELMGRAQKFIDDGAMTPSGQSSSIGEYVYRFYADVIDTETGKEIYFDTSESVSSNS